LKPLPLNQLHQEHQAKFGPFAGFDMPMFYSGGIITEHRHTRESAGLFDISHMVIVEISGPEAASLLEKLCPYDASNQPAGRSRYTFFLNEQAGIIDDLIVTRLAENRFQIVCNAACAEKDIEHIRHYGVHYDVSINIIERVLLALQGPQAESVMEEAGGIPVADMAFLDAKETDQGWFVARSGYTGEDGFEIAIPIDAADEFARKLVTDQRVMLVGLGARDSLRLEAGLPLYGQDLNAEITPMEAGIVWAVPKSRREGGDFVGAIALAQKIKAGRARKRIGLKSKGAAPVRAHAQLFDRAGDLVGEVTSGGYGPTAGHPVAFGLVEVDSEPPLFAEIRGKRLEMEQVKLPFVEHRYKK
jgi:aminomethyltransferase